MIAFLSSYYKDFFYSLIQKNNFLLIKHAKTYLFHPRENF